MFVSKIVQSIAVHKYLHKRILLLLYCCTTTINQRNTFVYQKYFTSGKIYLGFQMIIIQYNINMTYVPRYYTKITMICDDIMFADYASYRITRLTSFSHFINI